VTKKLLNWKREDEISKERGERENRKNEIWEKQSWVDYTYPTWGESLGGTYLCQILKEKRGGKDHPEQILGPWEDSVEDCFCKI